MSNDIQDDLFSSYKNQCIYTLIVTYENVETKEIIEQKVVSYPLTCEFNITKAPFSKQVQATFNIYNLSPSTRQSECFVQNSIFDTAKYKTIEFSAGYANNKQLTVCFKGRINEAYSTRRGTETVTTIQAVDMCEPLTKISTTVEKGTTFTDFYNYIASQDKRLPAITRGVLDGTFKTSTQFTGTVYEILNKLTGKSVFVDNSVIKMLNPNECLAIEPVKIDANSGLIGTPEVRGNVISATMLFNPNVQIGQRAELNTQFLSNYNGVYKIYGIVHNGNISGAVSAQRTTTLEMLLIDTSINGNVNTTGQTELQGKKVVDGTEVYTDKDIREAENVYAYIRKHNGKVPNWRINNLITWQDMLGQDNKDGERHSQLTKEYIANCNVIANKLASFLNASSLKGQRINVVSGWRSKENNARLNNASKESRHLKGQAIDFQFRNTSTYNAFNNVFKPLNSGWSGFTYLFKKNSYSIHVQLTRGKGGARR